MWLKLLYFLRIDKRTGYLIRMIFKVIFGMRTFLTVLLITITASADSQISIMKPDQEAKEPDGVWSYIRYNFMRFLNQVYFTYLMIIGGDAFTPNEGYETAGSILTIFTTLFVMIVMMNLLISIIGDIFSKV